MIYFVVKCNTGTFEDLPGAYELGLHVSNLQLVWAEEAMADLQKAFPKHTFYIDEWDSDAGPRAIGWLSLAEYQKRFAGVGGPAY
jgi:hypothetical protein